METELVYIILGAWIVIAFILGGLASHRTIGFWWVFLCSLFLSPIVAGILLLSSSRLDDIIYQNKVLQALEDIKNK